MAVGARQVGGNAWAIGVSITADGLIVPAPSGDYLGKRLKIVALFLIATTAETITLSNGNGGTDFTGPVSVGATGGWVLPECDRGWMMTSANTGLYANVGTGGIQVSGTVVYEYA